MNYYDAREISKDGKGIGFFHYTRMNDGVITPVGYCAEGCPGHKTKEEAYTHYKKYLLDVRARYDVSLGDWAGCKVCDKPTKKAATVGPMEIYPLCEEHLNRESLEKLVEVGQEVSSY